MEHLSACAEAARRVQCARLATDPTMTDRQIRPVPPDFSLEGLGDLRMHVVLVHPEIPQNTGNIARLCAGTDAWLHLVEPLGYVLEDRYLRRAGLDYWPGVRLSVHESLDALEPMLPRDRTWLFTKHADALYREAPLTRGAVLVFGCETKGLPDAFSTRWAGQRLRLPTTSKVRSLNLANAVAIGAYESLRQQGWGGEAPMPSGPPVTP